MSTALTTFNPSQLELIKNQIAKGCTDGEIEYFIGVCQRTGLDPFQRQIYAIRRKDNKVEKMTIQTGIDGYRLIADRTGRYAGSDDPIHHCDAAGNLTRSTVTVWKLVGGVRCPFTASALFDEYVQQSSPMWTKMKFTMLAKCAEALALRKSFPADLSGIYTTEEMMQSENGNDRPQGGNDRPPLNGPKPAPKPAPKPVAIAAPIAAPAATVPGLIALPLTPITADQLKEMSAMLKQLNFSAEKKADWAAGVKKFYGVDNVKALSFDDADSVISELSHELDMEAVSNNPFAEGVLAGGAK
jgi:phage recombination protein Bet